MYVHKNLFMHIKHIKSATGAVQTLNGVLHKKLKSYSIETLY